MKCERNICTGAASAEGYPLLQQANTILCEEVKLKKMPLLNNTRGGPQTPGLILEDLHLTRNLLGTVRFITELILDTQIVFFSGHFALIGLAHK